MGRFLFAYICLFNYVKWPFTILEKWANEQSIRIRFWCIAVNASIRPSKEYFIYYCDFDRHSLYNSSRWGFKWFKCSVVLLRRPLCGAISPSCLPLSPWHFNKWWEMYALRHCRSQNVGEPPPKKLGASALIFRREISYLPRRIAVKLSTMMGNKCSFNS